jgi:hypothetical protein
MGGRIPDSIRLQAIRKWLEGGSRDKIAQELQRSQGAVSDIIKDAAKNDPQYPLLREVAVKIKNQGMDIESFAPLVRLRAILRDKGVLTGSTGKENLELMQDRFEASVVIMEEFLFHKGLSIEDFFSLVTNMYNLADKVGVQLNEFPAYVEELKVIIDVLRKELSQKEKKNQDFLNDNKKTLELVQEYIANKPILVTVENLKEKLADTEGKLADTEGKLANAEKRIRELEELDNERRSNDLGKQNMGSVFETELEKATEELLPNMDMTYSLNTLKDVLKNPSRYMGVINRMSDLYDGYRAIQHAN